MEQKYLAIGNRSYTNQVRLRGLNGSLLLIFLKISGLRSMNFILIYQ